MSASRRIFLGPAVGGGALGLLLRARGVPADVPRAPPRADAPRPPVDNLRADGPRAGARRRRD